jgi:beta propeller repeat protein
MNKRLVFILIFVFMFGTLVTITNLSCTSQNRISVNEYLITTSDSIVQTLGISDGFICWQEGDPNTSTYRLMARELVTKTDFVIEPFSSGNPVWVAGEGYIVWMRNPEQFSNYYENIWVYDLKNRNKSQGNVMPGYRDNVRMSGTQVLWYESKSLKGFDIVTNEALTYPLLGHSSEWHEVFEFNKDYIVFYDRGQIIVYNIENRTKTNIPTSEKYSSIKLSGNILVWLDYSRGRAGDLIAYDLLTGKETRLPETWSHSWQQSVSDDIIVWLDDRNDPHIYDIYGYDLQTGTEFPVCTAPGYQEWPVIENDTVVWIDRRNGPFAGYSIYGAQILRNTSQQ